MNVNKITNIEFFESNAEVCIPLFIALLLLLFQIPKIYNCAHFEFHVGV